MHADPYEVLEVSRDADQATIKKAFRRIARENHPDVAGDDSARTERFKAAREAYEFLSDEAQRAAYDQGGTTTHHDFFEEFFRAAASAGAAESAGTSSTRKRGRQKVYGTRPGSTTTKTPPKPQRGSDVHIDWPVDSRVARAGGYIEVQYERLIPGHAGQPDAFGKDKTRVRVRAGSQDGHVERISLGGNAGPHHGPPGDLYVHLRISGDTTQDVQDAVTKIVQVSVAEAVLGAVLDVPTPRGNARIRLPAGTPSGSRMRLKGRGIGPGGRTVDLILEVHVVVPERIDERSAQLIREFDQRNPVRLKR